MSVCDLAPNYIREIAPYQPGKPISELERELGISNIIKLASNENPAGTSPLALAAMRRALDDVASYPDGNGFELKSALARRYGVKLDNIVLGNGSNDVLELAARAFLRPGASAIYSRHAFAVYPLAVQAAGASGIVTPAKSFGHDLEMMLRAIRDNTRIVFIANPNNPTGTFITGEQVHAFLGRAPKDVLIVLDEAYTEYLPDELRYDSIGWLAAFPNLVVTRTFSKAYGLAGLRVGYALCHPDVADLLNRVRQPFNVGSLALAAATAALEDSAFLASSRELNTQGLRQLADGFARLGLEYIASVANFISVRVGNAAEVYQRLLRAGVIVRPIAGYALPEYLRVTVGLPAQNERFLGALQQSLRAPA